MAGFFEKSENPKYQRIWNFMTKYNFRDGREGLQALTENRLQAIITTKLSMEFQWKKDKYCNLKCAGKGIQQKGLAFAFPIGSKWTKPISDVIRKYKEDGMTEKIQKQWLSSGCGMRTTNNKQFGMLYLSGLCIVLMAGFVLSLGVLALEHLLLSCVSKRRKTEQRNESTTLAMV